MADPAPRAASVPLRFSKMHGAGNDFIVLDLRDGSAPPDAALCRAMADRHTGVGCDQILTVEAPRSDEAIASYRIWNADGSPSQQCGNGARCIAAWLLRDAGRAGRRVGDAFMIDSPAGRHAVTRLGASDFRVALGVPEFDPARIPLHGVDRAQLRYEFDLDEVEPGAGRVEFGAVSMGNPHALIEVADIDTAAVAALGGALQRHPAFPQSVNVGFVRIESRSLVRLRVFERGVGETLACGSGACAAAAILIRRGQVDRDLTVVLPGGPLRICWPSDDAPVSMAGPAAFVFEGEWHR